MKYAEYSNHTSVDRAVLGTPTDVKAPPSLNERINVTETAVRDLISAVDKLGLVLFGRSPWPEESVNGDRSEGMLAAFEQRLLSLASDARMARQLVDEIDQRICQ